MKILIVGGGGREHALVWKLAQSSHISDIFCAPGNGGISELASCLALEVTDTEGVLAFSQREHIDLVVVGPENALAVGMVDALKKAGIPIFGPCRQGALIETSKVFAKTLMAKYGVPTAPFKTFEEFHEAAEYINRHPLPYVIKADGLCAGKGAYVINDQDEGVMVLRSLLVDKLYGESSRRVIVEDFLPGVEASYLAFSDGSNILPMLPSQDHKQLYDNDRGPNTGGMGAYTPVPFVDSELQRSVDSGIMNKTVSALKSEGIDYKGVLYGGLMIHDRVSHVVEFNARFGDPETQPILFSMESDLLPILKACTENRLAFLEPLAWTEGVSVCVVIASKGYPENPEKGKIINGLNDLKGRKDVMVFHAGTKKIGDDYYTSGGRVLGVTARGNTYKDAIKNAYDAVSCIHFEGMYYRTDIGKKAL
jgi:phosphoribosylamine---glycine ligase